jgi:hypothetical protein
MRRLYHVGNGSLKAGDSIAPGNWGKQTRQFGKGEGFQGYGNVKDAVIVGLEATLEVARQLTAPDAPSRLNCVFCTEDIESAKVFRDRFRNGESIYEVEVEDTVSTHAGNYDAITDAHKAQTSTLQSLPRSHIGPMRRRASGKFLLAAPSRFPSKLNRQGHPVAHASLRRRPRWVGPTSKTRGQRSPQGSIGDNMSRRRLRTADRDTNVNTPVALH